MRIVIRILFLLEAALSLAGLVLLARLRPEWPQLPASLSSPLTTVMVEQFVLVALWVATGLLLFMFFVRSIAAATTRSPPSPSPPPAPRARFVRERRPAAAAGPAFPPPFPLIVRRPSVLADNERGDQRSEVDRARAPGVRVAMLGPLDITTTWPRDRALRSLTQETVAYLALHHAGATVDELADALLPRLAADRARKRIWKALSEARSELGVILRNGDRYLLDRATVAIDVDEFEALVAQANAGGGGDRARHLEGALARVRGDPLAGADYRWAEGEMRHLRAAIVDALHDLGEVRLAVGDAAGALAAAERALEFDIDNESAHRLAMRAESALGLRDAVERRYEQLAKRLDRRFGLEPEQATRLVYRRLLSQDASSTEAITVSR